MFFKFSLSSHLRIAYILIAACLLVTVSGANAQAPTPTPTIKILNPNIPGCACKSVINLDNVHGILYKPENIHGGRGPTYLVQSFTERVLTTSLKIYDVKCRKISSFGFWTTDFPYGRRYYEKVHGGGQHTAQDLSKLVRKAGKNAMWVEAKGSGRCIQVNNPLNRQGVVD